MNIENVVRNVKIVGSTEGMDQVAKGYNDVASSSDTATSSMSKSSAESAKVVAALSALAKQQQDSYRQQQQFNDMMRQQSQALQQTGIAANDNAEAAKSSGVEWVAVANHLRQATEAAYVFSPAFAGVVNAMRAPALAATGTALTAVSAGIVTATNYAGTGLIALAGAAEKVSPGFLGVTSSIRSAGIAMEAFSPAAATVATSVLGVAGTIVSRFLPVVGQILLVYDAIKLLGEAWQLGGQKLQEYVDIANKAAKVDLSTDFFQRITKAATDAKLPVDDLTAAFTKLIQASSGKLGGSDLQIKLDALTKAGNFQGNSGVAQLAQADTTQQKFEAIVSLIDQAMQKGQRLAALDLANTAFGPAITDRLSKDSDYLDKLVESAKQVSATELVSDADVGRALDLQNRYDAAVKILEQRWHPIQDLLTQLGIQMQEAWVGIVESIASAVDWAVKLVSKLGDVPPLLQNVLNRGATAFMNATTTPESRAASETQLGISSNPADMAASTDAYATAANKLAAGLKNVNTVQAAVAQTNAVQQAVWKDTSHAIVTAQADVNDAVDRAIIMLSRHIELQKADTQAVGLGQGALAAFRAAAVETSAVQANDGEETAAQAAQFAQLKIAAEAAGDALAKAKVASEIDFAQKTAFLSPDDLRIAQQLRGIYDNDIPAALASTQAAQLRVLDGIKEIRDTGLEFSKSFVQGLLQGQSAMQALVGAADQLASKMADKALTDLFSGNYLQAGVEGVVAAGAAIFSGDEKSKQALQAAQAQWAAMSDQVVKFNQAAAGFNLGPLTNQLQSLYSSFETLEQAAAKAKDWAGAQQLANTFNQSIVQLVSNFEQGSATLTPLQTAIKGVNDEAAGLKSTLDGISPGYGGFKASIDAAAHAQIDALTKQFSESFVTGLTQRLNTANGQSYLNDAAALLTQHSQDFASAAELGNNPAVLSQISAVFQAEAQKIVENAGLVGDSFNSFIKMFPDFAGVVTQSATAIQAASDKFAALAKTINDYLDSLQVGSNSILSPQDQLGAAQSNFSRQLGLAQGGDSTAMGSITQYATTLLDQAKSYYASSSGYADIYKAVTSALGALTGYSGTTASSTSGATPSVPQYPVLGATSPSVVAAQAPSNDNGQYFASQTQTLVQAIAAACTAEVGALNDGIAVLSKRLDRIAVGVEANRGKAPRPAAKSAA